MIKLASNLQNLVKRSAKASPMSDYAMYGGAGALGGAGLGALINYLRDKSVAEGALVGGGLGGAAGLGTRGLMDLLTPANEMSTRADRDRVGFERRLQQAKDPVGAFVSSNPQVQELIAEYQLGPQGTLAQMLKEKEDIAAYQAEQAKVDKAREVTGKDDIYERERALRELSDAVSGRAAEQQAVDSEKDEKRMQGRRDRAALRSAGADFGANFKDNLRYAARQRAKAIKVSASSAGDYAMYGGAGALGGAGLGALINYLRDQPVAQGALVGGGLGGAAGLGTRGLMDLLAKGVPAEDEGTVPPLPTRAQSQKDLEEIATLESILPTLTPGSSDARQVQARIVQLKTAPTITPRELARKAELEELQQATPPGPTANEYNRELVGINVGR